MGLQDRDYMRVDKPQRKSFKKPSLWKRLRFRLHLFFHRKGDNKPIEEESEKRRDRDD
ncbi:MAG: hypothetical protein JXJ04_07620 [Spirochaetales bacterium]|nr:hypothetical protein [Spirochaetales bacterium]